MIKIKLKRGYEIEVKQEKEKVEGIDVLGNYSKSNYQATVIVNKNGIVPTIRENHGQVIGVVVSDNKEQKNNQTIQNDTK